MNSELNKRACHGWDVWNMSYDSFGVMNQMRRAESDTPPEPEFLIRLYHINLIDPESDAANLARYHDQVRKEIGDP